MTLLLALTSISSFALQDAAAQPPIGDLGGAVWATLADVDRDGRATFEECSASLRTVTEPLPVSEFKVEFFLRGIEQEPLGDRSNDVAKSLEGLDANGDGVIERRELRGQRPIGDQALLFRSYVDRTARLMLVETADRDGDGSVSAAERAAIVAEWSAAEIDRRLAAAWIEASMAREPENRNAMTPGVTMHTLVADVDPDQNGVLDRAQFEAWFRARDTNGDGALEGSEVQIRRSVEGSWQRITPERLALPPLMPWQRSLDDALAVQRRTGQPLLICVNMDGETACDSLAYWRYRDAEFAKLASGFVCLVVSPDDHSPRDYDDLGRRIVSPRLGRVTDAEHIDLEPMLYERYFAGRRVAPRHVGVAPDGSILFDISLTNEAKRIDDALARYGRSVEALDFEGMPSGELTGFRDADAQSVLEKRFLAANSEERIGMLSSAGADLSMLGLADPSEGVRAAAVRAMARDAGALSDEQRSRFARVGSSLDAESAALTLAALERAAGASTGAARAAAAYGGAFWPSRIGRTTSWIAAAAFASAPGPGPGRDAAFANLDAVDALLAEQPGLAGGALLRATALFQLGQAIAAAGQDPTDPFSEAVVAAADVEPAESARAQAIVACVEHAFGQSDASIRAAHRALPELITAQSDPLVIDTLRALQDSCTRRVYAAIGANESFLASDIADALLAGRTLIAHPSGLESDATSLITLLATVGDVLATRDVLEGALSRFPASPDLHARFRTEVLASSGSVGVASAYSSLRRRIADRAMDATLDWYEGLAELFAAEWDVRQADEAGALGHYDASLAAFGAAIEASPDFVDTANHYRVLAQAAAADLDAKQGNLQRAVERLVVCAALRPATLDLTDGLGMTPKQRAVALAALFDDSARAAVAAAFEAVSHPLD